ncbi:MAG: helix-turn-helix transcriptional regulator [Ruminococcaceae bacterium]|nr:helix-turn-helix transcriptional regulator [Oscillospiraceae bacterium]
MYVNYKEVGKRIAARRKELGLKQWQVNEMAELSDKYLLNIETARSIPSIDVLMRICEVLKTTPDRILIGAVNELEKTEITPAISQKIASLDKRKQVFCTDLLTG